MCALFLQIKSVRAPVSTLYSLLGMYQSANYRILSGLHEFLFPVRQCFFLLLGEVGNVRVVQTFRIEGHLRQSSGGISPGEEVVRTYMEVNHLSYLKYLVN